MKERILITGTEGPGGFAMRGASVAARLHWECLDIHKALAPRKRKHWKAAILVKYDDDLGPVLRASCDRLIFDPMDAWKYCIDMEPAAYWQERYRALQFDDILATSPSAAASMQAALPQVRVHLLPHHADPRVRPRWYDPAGPIVYAGDPRYLGTYISRLQMVCRQVGRRLVIQGGREAMLALRGACLALAIRLPPWDTPLNRLAKPSVKLENAAAAGLPVLCSDHPCMTSLRPEVRVAPGTPVETDWRPYLAEALISTPLANPVTLHQHVAALRQLVLDGRASA